MKHPFRLKKIVIIITLGLFFLVDDFVLSSADDPVQGTYKIGVVASRGREACLKQWNQTAQYLANKIKGTTFEIVPLDHGELSSAVKNDAVDFVISDPAAYVDIESLYGAQRIATVKNLDRGRYYTVYGSVVFTKASRLDISSFENLRGKRFAASDERSFGSWIAILREFKEHAIEPRAFFSSLEFLGTDDATVFAVLNGNVDAGSVRSGLLERMAREGKIDLKDVKALPYRGPGLHEGIPLLHSSRLYPEWTISKMKHTPLDVSEDVATCLMRVEPDDIAAVIGEYSGWTVPLNYTPVHEVLRYLRLGPYKDYGRISVVSLFVQYWYWIVIILVFVIGMGIVTSYVSALNRQLSISQEKIRQERDRVQLYLNIVGTIILALDTDQKVILINKKGCQILGYKEEEIIGLNWFNHFVPGKEKNVAQKTFAQLIRDEGAFPESYENEIITRQGRIRLIAWHNTVIRNEQGDIVATLSSGEDITLHKEAEIALQESRQRLSDIIDFLPDATFVIDAEGKVITWNKALVELTGVQAQEIIGRGAYEHSAYLYGERRPALIDLVLHQEDNLLASYFKVYTKIHDTCIAESLINTPRGKLNVWLKATPLYDKDNRPIGAIETIRDITERKKIEEAQRLAQLGKLVADMAHEVNNPLMIISGNAQLCLKENIENENIKENLSIIFEECKRAKDIIYRLLTFSRPSKGEINKISINNCVQTVLNLMEHQMSLNNVKLKRNFSQDLPLIYANEKQLQEVFMNLLNNASDAMPEGGMITVTTSREGDFVRTDVADMGYGMTDEVKSKIFMPFFTTKEKGTGLGLPFCQGIVQAYEGQIFCESAPGKGTIVTVLLPIR